MIKNVFIALSLAVLFVGFQNCSGNHVVDPNANQAASTVDVGQLQAMSMQVFQNKCASCHTPPGSVTTPINDIMNVEALITDGYIVPGEPQNSPIYLKTVDGIMPKYSDEPLEDYELDLIRDWIIAIGNNSVDAGIILPPVDDASFAAVKAIIDARCVSCHREGGSKEDLPLQTYDQIREQVNAGNAGSSPLYQEISGTDPTMPKNQSPLTPYQVATIRDCINQGANPDPDPADSP